MKKYIFISMAVLLLIASSNKLSAQACSTGVSQIEFEALVALFNSTNGNNWTNNSGWDINATACDVSESWYGLSVIDGHITEIVLTNNNLVGSIPSDIGNLTYLNRLYLEQNTLSGTIPSEIGNLTQLTRIYLNYNNLSGNIPIEIGNLANSLQYLQLKNNQLSGPIPSQIGNLINLKEIQLQENQLSGSIPVSLSFLTNMHTLYLHGNQLSGEIPGSFGNLISLQVLGLSRNQLSGSLPIELANLINLKYVYLYSNEFTGNIPPGFASLSNLLVFRVYDNNLESLPDFSSLNLTSLQVQDNALTFEDIEPNLSVAGFTYSPQKKFGQVETQKVIPGSNHTISVDVGGTNNSYQWYKDGVGITGGNESSFNIAAFSTNDAGIYYCQVTNSLVSSLILSSEDITLISDDSFYGTFTDNFEAHSVGNLNGQGNWVSGNENLAVIDVGGDKKVTTVNTNADTWCYVDLPFADDQYAEITMDAIISGADRGICVRASTGNAYVLTVSTGTAWLGKEVAGSWSNLDVAYSLTFNPGDVLRLSVKGTVLQALRNGLPIAGLGNENGEFTDAALATGKPGIFGYGGTGTQVDDFECGSITNGSISLDLTALQETATCQLSGIVMPTIEFSSNGIYNVSSGVTAGKADLTIQSTSLNQHIQFDVDANFNISNVKIEIEGTYIPLYADFFNITPDGNGAYNILEIGEIEDVCIYYPD
ncbi:MAG: immunoglobulin domain-containing protein [Bacteroidales bacterium]|nr:immunoglobulin domain-containing protein [Bacteroidales bacterium]